MNINLRLLYLYLFSFVGLLILIIGSIRLLDLGMKVFIFTEADRYEVYAPPLEKADQPQETLEMQQQRQERELVRRRQQELSTTLAMIAVGLPVYLYHWRTIQTENHKKKAS